MQFKGIAASSIDPTELSLTLTSASKVVIGIIGYYAAAKGLDASGATSNAQAFFDLGMQIVPAGFALYNMLMTAWGLLRKLYVSLFAVPAPTA